MAGQVVSISRVSLLLLLASIVFVESANHRHMLQSCPEGQVANGQGVCTMCADGYIRTSASPLVCAQCPCLSRGICQLDTTSQAPVCICPSSYHGVNTVAGTLCLQCPGYNTTTSAECSGHGTCHADLTQATNPSCSCANHWTGSECSECALGYTGADCNQCAAGFASVEGSCAACPGYCSSGQGTCQAMNGAATCQCGTGWTGSECSRPDTANGYFLVYDGNGDLVNGTVSSSPQHCSTSSECGFNTQCVSSFCQCNAGFTTDGSWNQAGSVGIKCSACPLGSYRGDVSTLPCTSCPYNRSTTATPGAMSPDQCISCSNDQMSCAAGTSLDPATCLCEAGSTDTAGLNVGSKVAIGILVPLGFFVLLGAASVYMVRMRREKRERGADFGPGSPGAQSPASAPSAPSAPVSDSERRENDSM